MTTRQQVDWLTMAGWGMLLMPLLTMWHEIGGHAAACVLQGGKTGAVGAFYVQCDGLDRWPDALVAVAGVLVNVALSLSALLLWRRAREDHARLVLWLIWLGEAFIAAGYLCFSGVTGVGDLGTAPGGSLSWLPMPRAWRMGEIVVGVLAYILLVRAGIRALSDMLGSGAETRPARRRIAHSFYLASGLGAALVGLLNPVGWFITIMSAAASSFGGLAGFISVGFAARGSDAPKTFVIQRSWTVIATGALTLLLFAVVFGPR